MSEQTAPAILLDNDHDPDIKKNETLPAVPSNQIIGIDVQSLLSRAIDNNTPVEAMEKLLSMSRELKADYAREQFNISLAEFQADCPEIKKTKIVRDKSGNVRYRYAPLEVIIEQVKKYLVQYGFSFTIKAEQTEKSFKAICEVRHIVGHKESTSFEVPLDPKAYMSAPQKVGSASTYSRRYAFCNAFGIMTADSDDDGNISHPENEKPKYRENPKGNRPPKLTAEQAKKEILDMVERDQKEFGTLEKSHADDVVNRINLNKPYKGGWLALHSQLKEKFDKEWFAY